MPLTTRKVGRLSEDSSTRLETCPLRSLERRERSPRGQSSLLSTPPRIASVFFYDDPCLCASARFTSLDLTPLVHPSPSIYACCSIISGTSDKAAAAANAVGDAAGDASQSAREARPVGYVAGARDLAASVVDKVLGTAESYVFPC